MNIAAARWPEEVPEFAGDDLPFDESALDKLKGSYSPAARDTADAPAWCGCCAKVSLCGDWAASGQCPHCREPLYARFLWTDLCRIKPTLPEEAPVGQTVAVYDYV